MTDHNSEQRDLLSDIKVLEQENQLLQDRAEGISLLQSAGDILYASGDWDKILLDVLEHISIYLNIPFCAFGVKEKEALVIQSAYSVNSNRKPNEDCVRLGDELLSWPDKEPQFISEGDTLFNQIQFDQDLLRITPTNIAIYRTSTADHPSLIVIFADDSDQRHCLTSRRQVLRAVIYKIITRLENLMLSQRLEQLNEELEARVVQGTTAFRESEERFRMIMHQSPNVMGLYNLEGLQVDVNEAYEKLWGISREATVGKFNIFKSEDVAHAGLGDFIRRAYAGESITVPAYHFTPTEDPQLGRVGKVRWLSTKIYPLKDIKGGVSHIVITHEDISQQKLAEEKLVESEARYRGLFESSIDAICTLDAEGNYVAVNPSAVKMLGYTREELLQIKVKDIVYEEDAEKSARYLDQLKAEGFYQGYEGRVVRKDGEIRNIEVSSMAIFKEGELVGSHDILRDVTERVEAKEKLAANLTEKELLLQEIQHRTKNNMMVIIALLNMQARESANPKLDEAFKVTQERIYAMSLVYDQLQKSDDLTAIDLQHYVAILSQKLHTSIVLDPGRIKLHVNCASIPISLTQAVPVGIVLNEIITNALQHAFPDERSGKIEVTAEFNEPDQLKISVMDDGVGMSAELIQKRIESLGLRLVGMLVEDQLSGKHNIASDGGLKHTIEFKLLRV